jgi:hypothetical protein
MKILTVFIFFFAEFGLFTNVALAQSTATPIQQMTNAVALVRRAPLINGKLFCCDSIVRAVNSLRHLGKKDALAVLYIRA